MVEQGVAGSFGHHGYQVTIQTMAGESTCLPWLQDADTVYDLARSVRSNLGIPISVQHLVWGTVVLEEPHMRLDAIFQDCRVVLVTLLRRPFTPAERAELHKRLVRATISGEIAWVRELLREGAQVNFDDAPTGDDASVTLDHWEDNLEKPTDLLQTGTSCGIVQVQEPARESDGDDGASEEESSASEAEDDGNRTDVGSLHPCGGLSPLLVALVAGHRELANDFRQLGAHDVDLKPSATSCIKEAFACKDFPDIARHMAQGADLKVRMARGRRLAGALDVWSIWPGSESMFGTPLHACAAMHKLPGAFETAQLLVKLGADLNAGDAEGDTPLAHTRYFRANEMHELYTHKGAKMMGPYYRRR